MNEQRFDDVTRILGKARSRREMLRLLALSAAAAFLAACQGKAFPSASPTAALTPSPSPSPSPSPTPSPSPDECPIPSTCGARQYCNDEQTCICIKSAEGQIRCGQLPSSCDVPLCKTTADCASFGEGWFCDVPNSGCCDDPATPLTRCLAPCGVGPAVTPTASPYATPQPTPTPGTATVTCPACGSCNDCKLSATNDNVTCATCTDTCAAPAVCADANTDLGFGVLASRLIADGYVQITATETELLRMYGADGLERSIFVSYFARADDPSQTAQLAFRRSAQDEVVSFAVTLTNGKPDRALFAQADGTLEEQSVVPTALSGGMVLAMNNIIPAEWFGCSDNCNIVCGATISFVAALAAAAICTATFGLCALLVFGGIAGGVGSLSCNHICNSYCVQSPQRVYCGCSRGLGCYDSASACTGLCHSGLGCFASNLCGPDPVCNGPLKQYGG